MIQLAGIEIKGVSNISVSDNRVLVEHRIPGKDANVLQDLGRKPTRIEFEGLFFGDNALGEVGKIRNKFHEGKPVDFASDITSASNVTQVMIKSFIVSEVAGRPNQFRYKIVLEEHKPQPPVSKASSLAEAAEALVEAIADQALTELVNSLKEIPPAVEKGCKELIDKTKEAAKKSIESVKNLGKETIKAAEDAVKGVTDQVKNSVEDLKKSAEGIGDEIAGKAKEAIDEVKDSAKKAFDDVSKQVKDSVKETADSIKGAAKEVVDKAEETMNSIKGTIEQGVKDATSTVKKTGEELVKVAKDTADKITQQVETAVKDTQDTLKTAVDDTMKKLNSELGSATTFVKSIGDFYKSLSVGGI